MNELVTVDLSDVAEYINSEYELSQECAVNAAQHAVNCGKALIDAKEQCPHGLWMKWQEENLKFSQRSARDYMRIASNWQHAANLEGATSIRQALKLLGAGIAGDDEEIDDSEKKHESTGSFHVSSKENDWYTPPEYIEATRAVLGEIDLDPATSDFAQQTVKAKQYYTKEDNSLDKPWQGKVWMNPPYSMPEIQSFAEKIVEEFQSGRVTEAIVLTNNSSDTRWFHALLNTSEIACLPSSRVKFYNPDSEVMATRQGQTLFYFGDNKAKFAEVFSSFGAIVEKR